MELLYFPDVVPAGSAPAPLNAFTVDVEDYYHVTGFEHRVSRSQWDSFESRVEPSTRRLLDRLDESGVKATFFVLGWVAERHRRLVRAIHDAGHEVGCHSYWHRLIYQQTPDEFRADLRRGRDALEDIHLLVAVQASRNAADYKKAREIGNKYAKFRAYAVEGLPQ